MERFQWFMYGMLTMGAVNMLTVTTPERAKENLVAWWRALFG